MGYNGSNRKGLPQRGSGFKKSSLNFGARMFSKSVVGSIGLVGSILGSLNSDARTANSSSNRKYYVSLGEKRRRLYKNEHDKFDLNRDLSKITINEAVSLKREAETYFRAWKMLNYEYILKCLIYNGFYVAESYKKLLKMYLKIGDYDNSLGCWKQYVQELTKEKIMKSNTPNIDYKAISKLMIENMIEEEFGDMDDYLQTSVWDIELLRAVYKYRDIWALKNKKAVI